jgi:beta-N-acetylglucosaminidase
VEKALEGYILSSLVTLTQSEGDTEFYLNLAAFPSTYHAALWDIHLRHPYWKLEPLMTGLSWTTVLNAESQPGSRRSLTPWYSNKSNDFYSMTAPDYVAGGASPTYIGGGFYVYDSPNWVAASRKMVAYYLDPRNFLNDGHIFQFEKLAYNPESQTLAGIENILSGGYMGGGRLFSYSGTDEQGNPATLSMSYAQAFLKAAQDSGVSPFHLASKARMEVSTTAAHTGTVRAGSDATHVVLAPTANPNDDFYNGFSVKITTGTGSGQIRAIQDYDGAARTATVSSWSTPPDETSTYSIGGSTAMGGTFLISSALGTLGVGSMTPLNQYYVCKVLPQHTDDPVQIPVYVQDPAYPDDPTKTILDHYDTIYVHYYRGYFNFYNIGAYPNPSVENGAMKNGIRFAQWGFNPDLEDQDSAGNRASELSMLLPWTDPLKAIVGGGKYIGSQYIYSVYGQDTMYLEKFNVVYKSGLYGHQYVQNVQAADDEGLKYYYAYKASGSLETPIVFRIPVYDDMPTALSPKPQ